MSSNTPFVDTKIIKNQMYQLNIYKPVELDGIHHRVLRVLVEVVEGHISIIFWRSWESGEVPTHWKLANVIPICKKVPGEDPGSYLSVSLTSIP